MNFTIKKEATDEKSRPQDRETIAADARPIYTGVGREKYPRTKFANEVYPQYNGNSELACSRVNHDIMQHLHNEMTAAGWVPGDRGYTMRQLIILRRFYNLK